MKKILIVLISVFGFGITNAQVITEKPGPNAFPLHSASIVVDAKDEFLVTTAASLFAADVKQITGKEPAVINASNAGKNLIIAGTIEHSSFIQQLIQQKKLNVDKIRGQWDAYQTQVVKAPFPGVDKALVITGSGKRGVAYGFFDLSNKMGVSPWYWWADVPAKKKTSIYYSTTSVVADAPKVKYRGIFINDEAPAFSGWTKEKFGGVNHLVYEKVFELILRLKGNYLWPAMWGNAFNDDDTLNPVLADQWGIVMGTSHHEPMQRAQQEWKRYGKGAWDYTKNDTMLREFWTQGVKNMGDHESLVTIGMRGDGDMPMTQGTATELLEKVVKDQRSIIEQVTGRPANETPQVWALYKEVQDYYDKGMRVPDDVTLLIADDNWGNIRRLPKLSDPKRKGGYGIYFHFDYVGGPRNYKWLNTNNIARVWEQMHMAYEYGVDKVWVVNVGDIKPMEFPISFFLDYAWNPKGWNEDNIRQFYTKWAGEQFGQAYAVAIGHLLRKYSQYSSRRKPELLDANTYSLTNYNEANRVLDEWKSLRSAAEKVDAKMPAAYKDAYFELVLHPIMAFTNLHELYHAVAMNRMLASQNNILANEWAEKAKQFYISDSLLTIRYNRELAVGKWNHMMDQTHIGYTYWQQPLKNSMPALQYVRADSAHATNAVAFIKQESPSASSPSTRFTEYQGYVSIDAAHYTKAVNAAKVRWKKIPDIGRTSDGVSSFPVTVEGRTSFLPTDAHLEFEIETTSKDSVKLFAFFSPTLNLQNDGGLKYAVSIDNEVPQIVTLNADDNNVRIWGEWVGNSVIRKASSHHLAKPGKHIVKYWLVSPGVVLQKLVLDFGGMKPSYFGPPETRK